MKPDIHQKLKKFTPLFLKAQEENLNEADTSQRIFKFFEDVLDYDPFSEITKEMEIRSKYVDLTIKIDSVVRFIVEVKSAGTVLRDRHLEQGERYAAEANIQWILLTNGVMWNLYHLTFDEGIQYERVFSVTLSEDSHAVEQASGLIGLLHRSSIKAGRHEEFWKQCSALSAVSIGKAIFFENTLLFIRREIRSREGILIDLQELANAIHSLFTQEAREHIGPAKIRGKRLARKPKSNDAVAPITGAMECIAEKVAPSASLNPPQTEE